MKYLGISVMLISMLVAVNTVVAQDEKPVAADPAVAPVAAPAVEASVPALPPPLELRKTGVISVTKDAAGKVTAIKLIVTSYDIILDEGSKALESKDGQKVRVTGTFSMQDNKRCFTVKNVEPLETDATQPAVAPAAPAVEKPVEAVPAK